VDDKGGFDIAASSLGEWLESSREALKWVQDRVRKMSDGGVPSVACPLLCAQCSDTKKRFVQIASREVHSARASESQIVHVHSLISKFQCAQIYPCNFAELFLERLSCSARASILTAARLDLSSP